VNPFGSHSVHENVQDEYEIEVNFDADSPEELEESPSRGKDVTSALSGGQLPLEQPALSGGQLPLEQPALRVEPTTALVKVPSPRHEKSAEGSTGSKLSITSDLIMREDPDVSSPAAETAKPVLNARSIVEIAENKEISIKTPVHNHNPQRQGLEDNLFDFGDALLDYTSDGGTIRINQELATFMLIAATAEVPNKLLMERKREAFEQVTAQAQDLLIKQRQDYEKQREAIALQHQEHMETMRKQNELLQEEVKKTRKLYSQTYQQFEVMPPQISNRGGVKSARNAVHDDQELPKESRKIQGRIRT
jgi:hypothetical protein